uniref:Uncharacterized protein n=1 Tax=mine drainage metagenome TaxID=410659 RepID=E6PP84_9ZZZZ
MTTPCVRSPACADYSPRPPRLSTVNAAGQRGILPLTPGCSKALRGALAAAIEYPWYTGAAEPDGVTRSDPDHASSQT